MPGQRRWVRLIFAGRDGMRGNRRELPLSSVAGHRWWLVPHRWFEGSPCGLAHPLLETEGMVVCSGSVEWLVGHDCPDEAGRFAGAGDNDLLLGLAASVHSLPAFVEPLLATPRSFESERVVPLLATGELVADLGSSSSMPGGFDQYPTGVCAGGPW